MLSLHGFGYPNGQQYTASFNFTDLYQTPVPDSIYDQQPRCARSEAAAKGGRYRPVPPDYSCARTAPYEPIIVIPLEVRELDPEWSLCNGGIRGVYDPPLALTPTDAIALPTVPSKPTTSTAAPVPTRTSDVAAQTTPKKPPTTKTVPAAPQHTPTTSPVDSSDPAMSPGGGQKPSPQDGNGGSRNEWPLPQPAADPSSTTNALSVLESALSKIGTQVPAAGNGGGAHGISDPIDNSRPQAGHNDPGSAGGKSDHDPALPVVVGQSAATWTHGSQVFTATPQGNSMVVSGNGGITVIAAGTSANLAGQHIEVPASSENVIIVDGSALTMRPNGGGFGSNDPSNDPGSDGQGDPGRITNAGDPAIFTTGGKTFTAVQQGDAVVISADGSKTTVATFGGAVISVPATQNGVVNIDGSPVSLQTGKDQARVGQPAAVIFTTGGHVFTAAAQGNGIVFDVEGTRTTLASGSVATIAGEIISVPVNRDGAIYVDGSPVTLRYKGLNGDGGSTETQTAAIWTEAGETFIAKKQGPSDIVLKAASTTETLSPGETITLGGKTLGVRSTGGVIVFDGTAFTLQPTTAPVHRTGAWTDVVLGTQTISARDVGTSVEVVSAGSTITLADGSRTTVGGTTFSALSNGEAIVINGTATLTIKNEATATSGSGSGVNEPIAPEAATATETAGGPESAAVLQKTPAWWYVLASLCILMME